MKLFAFAVLIMALANMAWSASVGKPGCGGSTSSKNIQLTNPKNPPRECVYKINAYSSNVCQLRIEFGYTLAPPSLPGQDNDLKYVQCDKDYFQAGDVKLCGTESAQHIYLPFNRTAGVTSVELMVALANRVSYNNLPTPKWNIFVTQLECPVGAAIRGVVPIEPALGSSTIKDGFFVAPPGCLQYFPYAEGTVTSFNFDQGKGIYPGKLNYAICFRRTEDTKALVLKSNFFLLGAASEENETDEYCYANPTNNGISSDYLMIPQAEIKVTGKRATYFCGDSIQGVEVVSTNPGPLMLLFNSDGLYTKESGFSFNYNVTTK
ncbi:uncharacterized protein LOC135960921 [Calliphora vicina]|uniref:uncharacterized protein LOC135960921 n=1 Tax=Calliphora vicina TaxID=7373 RepID=UPI00325BBE11